MKYLLHSHANVNARTNKGYTPLHYALGRRRPNDIMKHKMIAFKDYFGIFSVTSGMFENYLEITEILLMKKADVNSDTIDRNTALNFAMKIRVSDEDLPFSFLYPESAIEKKFRPEIVRCLLNYGASIHNDFDSELMTAIELECSPLVDILIEYDVNQFFNYARALELANEKKNRRIILSVIEQIDDIDTVARLGMTTPFPIPCGVC